MRRVRFLVLCLVLLTALVVGVLPVGATNGAPYTLTLLDDGGSPLVGQPAVYKYRCGGSWAASTPFVTDGSGQFVVTPTCSNWDGKVTVTLNQTGLEQDVTVNPVFQAARVDATLTSCAGPISDVPGGRVDQGGGYWYHHGSTGASGTVTFYTFPGTIKLRMTYNHHSMTQYPAIVAGANQVDFQTTAVTLDHGGPIKSNMGGSWWWFAKPTMNLLPGTYNFWFNGSGPNALEVSGCEMGRTMLRVVDENGNGVSGAMATPAVGGSWKPSVGPTNGGGYLLADLPVGTTRVRMTVNQSSLEQPAGSYLWITQILRLGLDDNAGSPITTGATLDQGGGYWYSWGSLGAYRDIPLFPGTHKFRVTYNYTSAEGFPTVVAGAGIDTFTFQTGQVFGSCITQYSTGTWRSFTDGMQLMPGTYTFRYPAQFEPVNAGGVTYLACP